MCCQGFLRFGEVNGKILVDFVIDIRFWQESSKGVNPLLNRIQVSVVGAHENRRVCYGRG